MPETAAREILLADDERVVRESLAALLENAGYAVRTARDGQEALAAFRERKPDLAILDVMMPRMNGFEACRAIRRDDPSVPVLFLTALDSDANQIKALGLGADDYIFKSTAEEVLLARIEAALRRTTREDGDGDFDFGQWRIDASSMTASRDDGSAVRLAEREIAILRLFAANPGEVFMRDWLAVKFWQTPTGASDNLLAVTMSRLRTKLAPEGRAIETVRGAGFSYRPRA